MKSFHNIDSPLQIKGDINSKGPVNHNHDPSKVPPVFIILVLRVFSLQLLSTLCSCKVTPTPLISPIQTDTCKTKSRQPYRKKNAAYIPSFSFCTSITWSWSALDMTRTSICYLNFQFSWKHTLRKPLALHHLETVSNAIKDNNTEANSYSWLQPRKDYVAKTEDLYLFDNISVICMQTYWTLILLYINLLVKHKISQNCESAVYFGSALAIINENCGESHLGLHFSLEIGCLENNIILIIQIYISIWEIISCR